ncbi:MAG TPA: ribonuclease HII [Geobacterales bacterium]|nr:ribonuclease HII [Geobacterales bacterium]
MELFASGEDRNPLRFEAESATLGYLAVAGVDEAGRGTLAGPVVAAAVILGDVTLFGALRDSKKLTPSRRDTFYDLIIANASAVGVGIIDHEVIDRINILQASLQAMQMAVMRLSKPADYLLVDGTFKVPLPLPQRAIVKGDDLSLSISAASIIAKVTRDRLMIDYDQLYPGYGFAEHKGYGAAVHLAAIGHLGPSPIHRRTFRGVREHLPADAATPTLW